MPISQGRGAPTTPWAQANGAADRLKTNPVTTARSHFTIRID